MFKKKTTLSLLIAVSVMIATVSVVVKTSFAQDERENLKTPDWVERLSSQVPKPESVESALIRAGKPARLINYHLATVYDFSAIGLGKCTYLPVQISKSKYGRNSTWFLRSGDQIVDGIIVVSPGKVMTMSTKRLSGVGMASNGDLYEMSIRDETNQVVAAGRGAFEVISRKRGVSKIRYIMSVPKKDVLQGKIIKVTVHYSHLWSCYDGSITYEYDDGK